MTVVPFAADYSDGTYKCWPSSQGADDAISIVPSPTEPSKHVVQFTIDDGDMTEASHLKPPRFIYRNAPAACLTSRQYEFLDGDDAWFSYRFWIPPSFPDLRPLWSPVKVGPAKGATPWILLYEQHGPAVLPPLTPGGKPQYAWETKPPFGSPANSFCLSVVNGQEVMGLGRGYPHYDLCWETSLVRGSWQVFYHHVKFSPDPAIGFRELYHQGNAQVFASTAGKTTRMYDATMQQIPAGQPNAGCTQALSLIDMLYCAPGKWGNPGPLSVIKGPTKSGPTLNSIL